MILDDLRSGLRCVKLGLVGLPLLSNRSSCILRASLRRCQSCGVPSNASKKDQPRMAASSASLVEIYGVGEELPKPEITH